MSYPSDRLSSQILFISGLAFVIGLERTFRFFFQWHKARGSAAFFGGIVVVLLGWPIIGMIIEVYGFVVLFSGFFPVAINFLRRIPVIGMILNMPFISSVRQFFLLFLFVVICSTDLEHTLSDNRCLVTSQKRL